ncbi:hypothetical protein [Erwinia sorbitola]|uniref:Uncharacterized protein n=1 Tax=Erwinia sorbitola TaxID=2681984 RepID=A0A6I6EIB6_9GAMM|nr:hypothetical protein [Erwinia sorbitola]MTD27681.1 hypothetical protein [Erwinia sorbitola]QGU86311.1 hypothetical protein GN242_03310 [Erwinia sorbitola]
MKKLFPLLILAAAALSLWWFMFRSPPHDPHYDAAACVAVDVLGTPTSEQDFANKIRTVIINENSSYSVKQVSYDDRLGRSSIAKYQALDTGQKSAAAKDVVSCIEVMNAAGH